MALSALVALSLIRSVPTELDAYVRKVDRSVKWTIVGRSRSAIHHLKVISQTWKGQPWVHDVTFDYPARKKHRSIALLFVTGGNPNPADRAMAKSLAGKSGMPVVTLFQIPNQPLWGLNEDALIAHTFEKCLQEADMEWPLVLPMAKSVRIAMNAVQHTSRRSAHPITKFVVFGASKRGWTSWLAAATGDARIVGIAPIVYDNLNIPAQLPHQLVSWGKYSEMIGDYTERGLPEVLNTPPGKKLASVVDPFSYLPKIKCPVLIVNGGNDRYWPVDAMNLYWKDLKMPKAACIVPNEGHVMKNPSMADNAIAAFAASRAGAFKFPRVDWNSPTPESRLIFNCGGIEPVKKTIFMARSATRDLRSSPWVECPPFPSYDSQKPWTAIVGVAEFFIRGYRFSLTTPVLLREVKSED